MHYSRRYLVFTIILSLFLVIVFSGIGKDRIRVEAFRGAKLEKKDWNPLIAASVNGNYITVTMDGKTFTSADGLYMDEELQIMMPVTLLREGLNCSAHIYDEDYLLVKKRDKSVLLGVGDTYAVINERETKEVPSPLIYREGAYYVPLNTLAELLDYDFNWDIESNKAVGVDIKASTSILPVRFDLREEKGAGDVTDQGRFGTCWAFATLTALESSLLPEEDLDFAEDHLSLANSFVQNQFDGGDYTMSMAYLAAWQGPVYESQDPYGDGETEDHLSAVKHVQEMQIMEAGDYKSIKEAVFKFGGVQTSIYTTLQNADSQSEYYNEDYYAYCYQGSEKPNHDVVIIGWDDNYPKENFSVQPEEDGAFICQNSWGTEFGDDGVFYISYYDSNIGIHNVVYTKVEEADNYDSIYQSDLCGWVGGMGFERESIYGANVFTAKSKQQIEAAGFYATGKDTAYDLYVVKNFENVDTLQVENRIKVGSGTLKNAGYYTIRFDKTVLVDEGERFAIVLYIHTPGSKRPMAVEYVADEFTENVVLYDGEGYISIRGSQWTDVEKGADSNLCIKAYGSDVE